jgi:hypothetical protein
MLASRPAAGSPLAFFEFLLGPANATLSGWLLLGVFDPTDELVARQRGDVVPGGKCRGISEQRRAQIRRQLVHDSAGYLLAAHRDRVTRADHGSYRAKVILPPVAKIVRNQSFSSSPRLRSNH